MSGLPPKLLPAPPYAKRAANPAKGPYSSLAVYGWPPDKDGRLVIPDRVTSIRDYVFQNCVDLESVTFPPRLKRIGKGAFNSCTKLREVHIPATTELKEIGSSAFRACSSLSHFSHPKSLKTNLKHFDKNMFQGCTQLPKEVKEGWEVHLTPEDFQHFGSIIPRNAFLGRTEITSVVFADSVTAIEENIFKGCTSLKSITFTTRFRSIGPGAFAKCSKLVEVNVPGSVRHIGDYAFSGCTSLCAFTFPLDLKSSLQYFGEGVFTDCNALAPEVKGGWKPTGNLTGEYFAQFGSRIPKEACEYRDDIKSITFPDSVTAIDEGVFKGCHNLARVIFPPHLESIGKDAFYECYSLTEIVLPGSVREIGTWAFFNCTSLKKLTILRSSSNVAGLMVGEQVFYDCPELSKVSTPDEVVEGLVEPYQDCMTLADLPPQVRHNAFKLQLNTYFWSMKLHRQTNILTKRQRAWIKTLLLVGSRARLHWKPYNKGPKSEACTPNPAHPPLPCIPNDVWLLILTYVMICDLGDAPSPANEMQPQGTPLAVSSTAAVGVEIDDEGAVDSLSSSPLSFDGELSDCGGGGSGAAADAATSVGVDGSAANASGGNSSDATVAVSKSKTFSFI